MKRTIKTGGVLAIECPECHAPPQHDCTAPDGSPIPRAHKARHKAAPRQKSVKVGDLARVNVGGKNLLAIVEHIGRFATVRTWRPQTQSFASARLIALRDVLTLADEQGAATKLAREELAKASKV